MMHAHLKYALLSGALAIMVACGDSTGPAVERNNPGTGTNTLSVSADIEGREVPGGFVTDMEVQVRSAQGAPVSGATVTIRNGTLGTTTLFESGPGSGDYVATVNRFDAGDYRLDVVAGTDRVENVVVGGIGIHTIQSPTTTAVVPANQPLTVTWTRPAEAFRADVESRDYDIQDILDTGSHVIPAVEMQPRTDERIRVRRENRVTIAGGISGSRLKVELERTLEPIVVQ